jgi:hypothetical protein
VSERVSEQREREGGGERERESMVMLRRSTEVPLTLATPLTSMPRAAGPWQSQDAGILTGSDRMTPEGWVVV